MKRMAKRSAVMLLVCVLILALPVQVLAQGAQNAPELPDDVAYEFKRAWYRRFSPIGWGHTSSLFIRYYGEYDGVYVGFVDGTRKYEEVATQETVCGYTFTYPTTQRLLVFNGLHVRYIEEAYALGWLTEESVARLHSCYTTGVYSPTTGDFALIPAMVLLLISVTGLAVLTFRKKRI